MHKTKDNKDYLRWKVPLFGIKLPYKLIQYDISVNTRKILNGII